LSVSRSLGIESGKCFSYTLSEQPHNENHSSSSTGPYRRVFAHRPAVAGARRQARWQNGSGSPAERRTSVSIAVVRNGKLVYAKAFGSANVAAGRYADAATRYALGSISKQFTAAAILLLDEQGKLSIEDKVSKYFPNLTRAGEISIRQLLTHVSGYEDYAPQDYIIPSG